MDEIKNKKKGLPCKILFWSRRGKENKYVKIQRNVMYYMAFVIVKRTFK